MRELERALIYGYFYNEMCRTHEDIRRYQQNLRYRNIYDIDCYELMRASIRAEVLEEVRRNLFALLKMK